MSQKSNFNTLVARRDRQRYPSSNPQALLRRG